MPEQSQRDFALYRDLLVQSRAIPFLAIANILVYVALVVSPDLAEVFLLVPDQIQARPWTVITVFFSHELHPHLLGNLLLLFVFGIRLEKHTGPLHTLILYFVTGIAGSLAILGVAEIGAYDGGIAGASAAGFGLLAAIATLSPDSSVGGKLGGKMSLKSLAQLAQLKP